MLYFLCDLFESFVSECECPSKCGHCKMKVVDRVYSIKECLWFMSLMVGLSAIAFSFAII